MNDLCTLCQKDNKSWRKKNKELLGKLFVCWWPPNFPTHPFNLNGFRGEIEIVWCKNRKKMIIITKLVTGKKGTEPSMTKEFYLSTEKIESFFFFPFHSLSRSLERYIIKCIEVSGARKRWGSNFVLVIFIRKHLEKFKSWKIEKRSDLKRLKEQSRLFSGWMVSWAKWSEVIETQTGDGIPEPT